MKQILLLPFLCLSLMSCVSSRYITIDSDELKKDDASNLVYETDSLAVTYSFQGNGVPIRLHIENKLENPLFVDWSNSLIIMNGQRNRLSNLNSRINMNGTSVHYDSGVSHTNMSGIIRNAELISIIPKKAFESINVFSLYRHISMRESVKHDIKIESFRGKQGAYIERFDAENSSNKFRVFVAMSYDPTFSKVFYVDKSFYVSEIIHTDIMPEEMTTLPRNRGHIVVAGSSNTASGGNGGGGGLFAFVFIITPLILLTVL